jgi:hypothetical protein
MWPPSYIVAIQKMKVYSKPEQAPQTLAPQLPLFPASFSESEVQLQRWKSKVPDLLSSPSRLHFQNWIKGTEQVLIQGQIKDLEHSIFEQQVQDQRQAKAYSRRTLKTGGALTAKEARYLQSKKVEKEAAKQAKRAARALKSQAVQAQKLLHQAGVQARKEERARKRAIATLNKRKQPIPDHLLQPILDPEAEVQVEAQVEVQVEDQAKTLQNQDSSEESGSESSNSSVQFFL